MCVQMRLELAESVGQKSDVGNLSITESLILLSFPFYSIFLNSSGGSYTVNTVIRFSNLSAWRMLIHKNCHNQHFLRITFTEARCSWEICILRFCCLIDLGPWRNIIGPTSRQEKETKMGGVQTAWQTGLKPGDTASGKRLRFPFRQLWMEHLFWTPQLFLKWDYKRNRFPLSPVCLMGATSRRILPNELEIWG